MRLKLLFYNVDTLANIATACSFIKKRKTRIAINPRSAKACYTQTVYA